MKKIKIMLAAMLLCSAVFTACKKENDRSNQRIEDDPSYTYIWEGDGSISYVTIQVDGVNTDPKMMTHWQWRKTELRQDSFGLGYNYPLKWITPAKIALWDAASGVAISTPTNLASGSRVINTSTVSPTTYSVAVRTHLDFSASANINIGVLGSGTGTVWLETSSDGGTTYVKRGAVTGVAGTLIGLNTTNYGSFGVNLESGNRYKFTTTTTTAGIGNSITYAFAGGSYYTY